MTIRTDRPRVLIVEDSVLIQESIRLVLEGQCNVVSTAEDAETALAVIDEVRPDIVTIDVSLPKTSGFEVAETLARTAPSVNVVFVTAHTERVYVERAFEMGAHGYVLKGAMQAELPAAIREIVAGGRFLSPRLRSYGGANLKLPGSPV